MIVGVNQYVPSICSAKILEPQDGAILSRVCASEVHIQLLAAGHGNNPPTNDNSQPRVNLLASPGAIQKKRKQWC
jgi:hypothetical protein